MTRPGDTYQPETGTFLGELTDELDGGKITEFIGAGPKNYAYKCKMPNGKIKHAIKIRGFTLNHTTAQHLTFNNMKQKVLNFIAGTRNEKEAIVTPCIRRKGDSRQVVTEFVSKDYGVVYSKRFLLPNGNTLPYGTVE